MKLLFLGLAILTPAILAAPIKAANPEAVKQLLETNECPDCDLSGANLAGAELSYSNLQRTDLCNANLSGADLRNANLRDANLDGASLRNASLIAVDFSNTSLTNVAGLDSLSKNNTPQSGVQVSQLGQVRAELYYQQEEQSSLAYKDLRLRLLRNGQLLLEQKPTINASEAASEVLAAPRN